MTHQDAEGIDWWTKAANLILCDTVSHREEGVVASSAKDVRAVRSRAALRAALLRLLEEKPFDQVTIRQICTVSGVHYATFFRHYSDKEVLLDEIAADQIAELVNLTLPIQEKAGHAPAIETLFDYIDDHRSLWSALLNGGAGAVMGKE